MSTYTVVYTMLNISQTIVQAVIVKKGSTEIHILIYITQTAVQAVVVKKLVHIL